tara:strand:- start:1337 stop:2410 length:1074 start_codon:yes stop_codon:yes gene_type:complete
MKEKILKIGKRKIGKNYPTFFIADIAANHDGNLQKALKLINLAAEAGADAVKFQHFKAETIVSDFGFKKLGSQQSHQKNWKKSVFEVYKDASIDLNWTKKLKKESEKAGVIFFTSPYSLELVDYVDRYIPAYKIGSGDITYIEIIEKIAKKKKPYIIATGASSIQDVSRAVNAGLKINKNMALLQCNTNYTASLDNFKHIHLKVLERYKKIFPGIVLGLSDHTPGHASVLGSVALGGRVIEKHFTDDNDREGPDHLFSMNPNTWKEMVDRTRELELSLGTNVKKVEKNESETVVLQRRSVRAKYDIKTNEKFNKKNLICLRPSPKNAIQPYDIKKLFGKRAKRNIQAGDIIRWKSTK